MNKAQTAMPDDDDDLRPEYDAELLARGIRGKYHAQYVAGTNLARLAPDVRAAFPTDAEINEALRMLIRLASAKVPVPPT
ncbi:MAG: hypothetical protein FJX72_01775 [Armatimonadetes bacterium]|nr:hypothetical protein [Armatimonadota bacterium]